MSAGDGSELAFGRGSYEVDVQADEVDLHFGPGAPVARAESPMEEEMPMSTVRSADVEVDPDAGGDVIVDPAPAVVVDDLSDDVVACDESDTTADLDTAEAEAAMDLADADGAFE